MEIHGQCARISLYKFSSKVSFHAAPLSGWYWFVFLQDGNFRFTLERNTTRYSYHPRCPGLFLCCANGNLGVSGDGPAWFAEIEGGLLREVSANLPILDPAFGKTSSKNKSEIPANNMLPANDSPPDLFIPEAIEDSEQLAAGLEGLLYFLKKGGKNGPHLRTTYLSQLLLIIDRWEKQTAGKAIEGTTYSSRWSISDVAAYIDSSYTQSFTLDELAAKCGLNSSYFSKTFREEMGVPLFEYINQLRIKKACQLLKRSIKPVTEIAFEVGYNNITFFNRYFKRITGTTPREFRR